MNEVDLEGKALGRGCKIAGRYEVLKVLGVGGFGITYKCRCADGSMAAVKEYFRGSLCSRSGTRMEYSDPVSNQVLSGMKAFVNEGKRLMSIAGRHPNIVKVKELLYDNSTVYIAMELVEGADLDASMRVSRKGLPMDQAQAAKTMLPVIDAVAMLHSDRITHLDIKPANIILSEQGGDTRPVLIDFGLSKHYGEDGGATTVNSMQGCTPGYTPPEQYAEGGEAFSPQSDVYSLGATMYFLLVGKNPPAASSAGSGVVKRNLLQAGAGEAMASVVARAMSTLKDDRQTDAHALKKEIEEALAQDGGEAKAARPLGGWGVRRRVLAIISAFAFVAIAMIVWFVSVGIDPAHPEEAAEEAEAEATPKVAEGVGYSVYGDDIYENVPTPGAMLNIDQMPVEPSIGEKFTVEIGIKSATGIENADSLAAALMPALKCSEYEGLDITARASGGDSLTIFSYAFRIVAPGTEEVVIPEIEIDGRSISLPAYRF